MLIYFQNLDVFIGVFGSLCRSHCYIINRLSEATELLSEQPQAEAWGYFTITALRADKSDSYILRKSESSGQSKASSRQTTSDSHHAESPEYSRAFLKGNELREGLGNGITQRGRGAEGLLRSIINNDGTRKRSALRLARYASHCMNEEDSGKIQLYYHL